MLLVDCEIRKEIETGGRIDINPYNLSNINSNSYDLTLGSELIVYRHHHNNNFVIDPYDEESIVDPIFRCTFEQIELPPKQFILADTVEYIALGRGMVGIIDGKSSLARLGLMIHQTGGFVDEGFEGTITLEIVNNNPNPIMLYAGMPICQIRFEETNGACKPYNVRSRAKYSGQRGPQMSKFYLNPKPINGIEVRNENRLQ